jgi:hypothetical protein
VKLPYEIDALMWDVAEADTPELMEDFIGRYPQYKDELTQRVKMVRQLKGARPKTAVQHDFVPSTGPIHQAPSRFWMATTVTMLMAAVVFATYGAINYFDPRLNPDDTPTVTDNSGQTQEVANPKGPEFVENTYINPVSIDPNVGQPDPIKPFEQLITIQTARMSLMAVLQSIAQQAGVRLQAAPGIDDIEITASYANQPAWAVLNDLGRNFGFTPLEQTEREALLIPATDPISPPEAAGGESFAHEIDQDADPEDPLEGPLDPPAEEETEEPEEEKQDAGYIEIKKSGDDN